jgi:uncharacterized protein YndB with AHSA1/START domain
MAMHLVLEVDIDSDAETVFSWLATPERARVWMTSVAETEMIEVKEGMVGSTFRERVEEGGGGVNMQGSVTAFDPNRRISFHLDSRVNSLDVDYRVDAFAAHAHLTVTSDIQWRFPVNLASVFFGRTMKTKIIWQSTQELARLKALCEARSPE